MSRIAFLAILLCLTGCDRQDEIQAFTVGDGSEEERVALERLQERADRGDVHSAFLLVMFGDWHDKAYDEAIPKLVELADRGSVGAARMLALAYRDGRGVGTDYDEAARWLERAAELGDEAARVELAAYAEHKALTAPD